MLDVASYLFELKVQLEDALLTWRSVWNEPQNES